MAAGRGRIANFMGSSLVAPAAGRRGVVLSRCKHLLASEIV
jgi:hypothetical protein